MSKPFCENRRVARCFAELFWTEILETIHDVVKQKKRNGVIHPGSIQRLGFRGITVLN